MDVNDVGRGNLFFFTAIFGVLFVSWDGCVDVLGCPTTQVSNPTRLAIQVSSDPFLTFLTFTFH